MPETDNLSAFAYPARIAPDGHGRLLVTFRDLPEAATDGADVAEARHMAVDCLSEALLHRAADGDMPTSSKPRRGEVVVAPYANVALKLGLIAATRRHGLTPTIIAKSLGIDRKDARRLLDPGHRSKAEGLTDALAAAGVRVEVVLRVDRTIASGATRRTVG